MIENLKGIYETVNFKENTYLRLYDNEECENYPPHWHTPVEIIMPTENIYTVECCNQRIVLRENDISNASAVAHDYVARTVSAEEKAKAENSIKTRLLNNDIAGLVGTDFSNSKTSECFLIDGIQATIYANNDRSFAGFEYNGWWYIVSSVKEQKMLKLIFLMFQ